MSPLTVSVCLAVLVVTVEYGATKPSSNSKVKVGVVKRQARFNGLQNVVQYDLKTCCSICLKKTVQKNIIETPMVVYNRKWQMLCNRYCNMCQQQGRNVGGRGMRLPKAGTFDWQQN